MIICDLMRGCVGESNVPGLFVDSLVDPLADFTCPIFAFKLGFDLRHLLVDLFEVPERTVELRARADQADTMHSISQHRAAIFDVFDVVVWCLVPTTCNQ